MKISYKMLRNSFIITMFMVLVLSSSGFSGNLESENKVPFKIGLQSGLHSPHLYNDHMYLKSGIYAEIYLRFNFSSNVHSAVGFSYWKAQTSWMWVSETVERKGIKFDLDFTLFKINNISFLLGPSVSLESDSKVGGIAFAPQLKINYPIYNSRFSVVSTVAYKSGIGGDAFNFGGSSNGYYYSFVNYMIGVEFNPWN